jgi:type II secretion system protein C
MNINFNQLYKRFGIYIIVLVFAYIINGVLFFVLPKVGVDYIAQPTNSYKQISLASVFDKKSSIVSKPTASKEYVSVSNMELMAVYAMKDGSGWAIVKRKNQAKTTIIKQNDTYNGYVLKKLLDTFVLFEKQGREYKLAFPKVKKKFSFHSQKKVLDNGNIAIDGNRITIKRTVLRPYLNNEKAILKEVTFKEVKKSGLITGYELVRIQQRSLLEKLGLQKGDVVLSVNDISLNSYANALKWYKTMNTQKTMKLVVSRKNITTEFIYEIN